MRCLIPAFVCLSVIAAGASGAASAAEDREGRDDDRTIVICDETPVWYDAERAEWGEIDVPVEWTTRRRDFGRALDVDVDLPELPETEGGEAGEDEGEETKQVGDDRLIAHVKVEPVMKAVEKGRRPGDPWPRIGRVSIIDPDDEQQPPRETELMRFVTPFGGPAEFTADVTALAPLLAGRRTIRVFVDTWTEPGWQVSCELRYECGEAGYRRPTFARRVFPVTTLTADEPAVSATVTIPEGLARPRLIVYSTGHATDGDSGDEFISRTHLLRVNGEMLARWRPWREGDAGDRSRNPTSGRRKVDGRKLWSSDLDRSGWLPGRVVHPMIMPAPELTPGEHQIELSIRDIRPADDDDGHGFWMVSAIVVADDPWPEDEQGE